MLVTEEDGRARLTFPAEFSGPVLTVLPVGPEPESDGRTMTAAIEEVAAGDAAVRVWRTRPRRGQGVFAPSRSGVVVHVSAVDVTESVWACPSRSGA
ncbi:hypothetical protein [Streptomyces dysideae]|uniref:hypothetical protein n=1 Tax=Streptomyces dysideae TaxID=909626 RepID=UPI00131B7C6F|nr:hypothetical protein [Streptomyces dysideae]